MRATGCLVQNRVIRLYRYRRISHLVCILCVGAHMRFVGLVSVVFGVALASLGPVSAQSLRASTGPAEVPPAIFTGAQYIDSHGCAFIRAGQDGNVTWVPRVTRDRKLLCGLSPSLAAGARAQVVQVQPAPLTPQRVTPVGTKSVAATAVAVPAAPTIKVPRGYKAAWSDGRLNANRGPKTAAGDAQMRTIWADTLPQQLVGKAKPATAPVLTPRNDRKRNSSSEKAKSLVGLFSAGSVTVSTKSNPQAVAGQYIQVATFGQPANAKATMAKLQGVGLPVSTSKTTRSGSQLVVVLVGPLAAKNDVANALTQVRSIGFSDAFLR